MDDRFSTLNGDLMTEALMMEEFNRLVKDTPAAIEVPTPQPTPTMEYTQEFDAAPDGTLEEMIQTFQKNAKQKLNSYLEKGKRKQQSGNCLLFLDGWDKDMSEIIANKTTGGFFFSHEGFGIAVNPGRNFLNRFHASGRHIAEIDAVIVTRDNQEDAMDLLSIYQLNQKCNLSTNEFHLIRYMLHPSLFRKMAPVLKPHFKQERNSCVSLDIFEEKETIDLSETIGLTYQYASPQSDKSISLVFEMQDPVVASKAVKLGYISAAPYSTQAAHSLKGCQLLVLGFEETAQADLAKQEFMKDGLGYLGTFNLCREVAPKMAFIAEQTGSIGDMRIEILKRLKNDLMIQHCPTTLFPVDAGLTVDLNHLKVQGTSMKQWIDAKNVRVIQPQGPNSPLHYLSIENIL